MIGFSLKRTIVGAFSPTFAKALAAKALSDDSAAESSSKRKMGKCMSDSVIKNVLIVGAGFPLLQRHSTFQRIDFQRVVLAPHRVSHLSQTDPAAVIPYRSVRL